LTPEEDYDAVFTCPPYHNTEIYNNKTFKSLEDFENFMYLSLKASVKESVKVVGIVMNKQYAYIVKEQAIKNGLVFVKEIPLGLKYNHFQRSDKKSDKSEMIYVFSK
jgi:predicted CoA-binding protein